MDEGENAISLKLLAFSTFRLSTGFRLKNFHLALDTVEQDAITPLVPGANTSAPTVPKGADARNGRMPG
jgi:hypothetical protein